MIIVGKNKFIMTDHRQENAIEQLRTIVDHPSFKHEKVRVMPDYHMGAGVVIGFTSSYSNSIIPNVVGVDIGCGVVTYPLEAIDIDFSELDADLRKRIPLGFNHQKDHSVFEKHVHFCQDWLRDYEPGAFQEGFQESIREFFPGAPEPNFRDIRLQLGTLGGGNHFIEVEEDNQGKRYLSIHSGSRNFGLRVADAWQRVAKQLMKTFHVQVPRDLEFLPMDFGGREYVCHMLLAQHFAQVNRRMMLAEALEVLGLEVREDQIIESVHNYIDVDKKIIRKGAIEADPGKRLVIPLNMRDGIILGRGSANQHTLDNWNHSAPHGAGRIMSRRQAHKKLSLEDFEKSMEGIWSSSVSQETLDEAPMVYKDPEHILADIAPVVEVEEVIKPIYSLKSSEAAI